MRKTATVDIHETKYTDHNLAHPKLELSHDTVLPLPKASQPIASRKSGHYTHKTPLPHYVLKKKHRGRFKGLKLAGWEDPRSMDPGTALVSSSNASLMQKTN